MMDTDQEALDALSNEFALFKCDRLFVVSPVPDADGCYPAISTVERGVVVPGLGAFCPRGKYKFDGKLHDCAAGIDDYIQHVIVRWVGRGMDAHVVAFAYFCDRQARAAACAADAACTARAAARAARAAFTAARAADAAYTARAAARAARAAYTAHAADAACTADAAARAADAACTARAAARAARAAYTARAAACAADAAARAAACAADAAARAAACTAYAADAAADAADAATRRAQLAFIKRIDPEAGEQQ